MICVTFCQMLNFNWQHSLSTYGRERSKVMNILRYCSMYSAGGKLCISVVSN
ncbi:hypothetical protein C5167_050617 [Papaver somniferum]|uniref:Uncharacterized protein n=1 Tax=Papaver somniferum TaxID=3469 RepID=A0A4Y7KSP2_PAPSO|nr:hypothetical protein C5167_050617 [Papaver somniferum]